MPMKIGQLSRLTGCRVVTIRYYEREGLLPPPVRSAGNYRLYDDTAAQRLRFIRHCRQHGISLGEIRELLRFSDRPTGHCHWINALVQRHIDSVEAQIRDLEHLKGHLQALLCQCSGVEGERCGILRSLNEGNACAHCRQRWDAASAQGEPPLASGENMV